MEGLLSTGPTPSSFHTGCCLKVSHSLVTVKQTIPESKTHSKVMDPCSNKTPGSTLRLGRRVVESAARPRVEQESCRGTG